MMLTSSVAQYINPDYLQPLPTTVSGLFVLIIFSVFQIIININDTTLFIHKVLLNTGLFT